MNRFLFTLRTRFSIGLLLSHLAALASTHAADVMVSHPLIERTGSAVTKQLGDFGESFVGAGLRAGDFRSLMATSASTEST